MMKNNKQPEDYFFDVFVSEEYDEMQPSIIALSEDGISLDDSLGSHSLSQCVIDALNNAGIFGEAELMEAFWEVCDGEEKTKDDIIKSMKKEGFKYKSGLIG